jgi:hypothetical protein
MEEKLYTVVTKTAIVSKPMGLAEAEKRKEKMLKKVNKTSKLKSTLKKLIPQDARVINIDEVVEERQKGLRDSIEILPYDDEKFIVVSNSTITSKGKYTEERAIHLRDMIVKTYTKLPSANKMVTVDIVEEQ